MRWLLLSAWYLVAVPLTVYASKEASTFYFTIGLIIVISVSFFIGMKFRKREPAHRNNRLNLID